MIQATSMGLTHMEELEEIRAPLWVLFGVRETPLLSKGKETNLHQVSVED